MKNEVELLILPCGTKMLAKRMILLAGSCNYSLLVPWGREQMIKMSLAVETISYDHLFLPFFFFLKVGEDFLQSIVQLAALK